MRANRIITALLFIPATIGAQTTVATSTDLHAAPDGRAVAALASGAPVRVLDTKGAWTRVVIDGFLLRSAAGPKADTFPITVRTSDGALLRASADREAPTVARLSRGTGLSRVGATGDWLQVRRAGWIPTDAVHRATAIAPPAAREGGPSASGDAPAVTAAFPPLSAAAFTLEKPTDLRVTPEGAALGTLDSTARVHTIARERGWVRVAVEGWVRESDLVPADTLLSAISAADLRAQPDRYRGQQVRWVVQKIAFETADPLRKNLGPDEPYLLARGPGGESSLLYLALPPSLVETGRGLEPLASIVVVARVRVGRSDPSGVPILDVESIAQR